MVAPARPSVVEPGEKKKRKKRVPGSVRKAPNTTVTLLKSIFKGRPSTIFFPYPAYCKEEKD